MNDRAKKEPEGVVLTPRPVRARAGKRSASSTQPVVVDAAGLLEWLQRAEQRVPQIRQLLAAGLKRPDLRKRAVLEATEELRLLAAACAVDGAKTSVVDMIKTIANPRVVALAELLYRAKLERL